VKTVILAGGRGTRLAEETATKPKPMVEIGGKPILWHLMQMYAGYGYKEFLVALGYKGEIIKSYFTDYKLKRSSFFIDLSSGHINVVDQSCEDWKVGLIDTGEKTETGGRVKRMTQHIGNQTFMMTYGDGLASVDVRKLVEFHRSHGKLATVTAVRPSSRFGGIEVERGRVIEFVEKPQIGEGWINGGFFVLEPQVMDYIEGDQVAFERQPLERLVADGQLMAYEHEGFWQPMDTLREVSLLNELWCSGQAPWKSW
jgi:glucose-1-phosphate cytidylyltransferase